MAKRPTISHYSTTKGKRFLFLNGGAVKRAINRARTATPINYQPNNDLANFAKVAVYMSSDNVMVRFSAKQSAAHAYEVIGANLGNYEFVHTWAGDICREFGHLTAPQLLALRTLLFQAMTFGATAEQFEAVAAFANAAATDDNGEATTPKPTAPSPAPQPTGWDVAHTDTDVDGDDAADANDAAPQGSTPAPAPAKPTALDAFGALGEAIRGEINNAVGKVKVNAPTVTVNVPGYTPVTLPQGEVLHEQFARLMTACTAQDSKNRNALLLGPRGSGKTHAAEQVARSLGLAFDAVSMSGGTTERAFWGMTTIKDGNMVWKASRFVEMFATGGVFLIDELDKADATVVTALNMATSNGYICPVDGPGRIDRHADFIIVACANALNADRAYTGSSRPDASSLDRFARIPWDYSPAITARAAAECGDASNAAWLIKATNAMRKRIADKGWRGELEWGTRNICRVAAWLRAGQDRATAIEWEIDTLQPNHANELRTVAQGIA